MTLIEAKSFRNKANSMTKRVTHHGRVPKKNHPLPKHSMLFSSKFDNIHPPPVFQMPSKRELSGKKKAFSIGSLENRTKIRKRQDRSCDLYVRGK